MSKWFPSIASLALRICEEYPGDRKHLLDRFVFDAKRESLQLLRSLDDLQNAVKSTKERSREWNDFDSQSYEYEWMRKSDVFGYTFRWGQFCLENSKSADEILSIYCQTLSKSIEERLPADFKEDVFDSDWSVFHKKGSKRKSPKTELEKAHRKGYEEGYRAAMGDVELQIGRAHV